MHSCNVQCDIAMVDEAPKHLDAPQNIKAIYDLILGQGESKILILEK